MPRQADMAPNLINRSFAVPSNLKLPARAVSTVNLSPAQAMQAGGDQVVAISRGCQLWAFGGSLKAGMEFRAPSSQGATGPSAARAGGTGNRATKKTSIASGRPKSLVRSGFTKHWG